MINDEIIMAIKSSIIVKPFLSEFRPDRIYFEPVNIRTEYFGVFINIFYFESGSGLKKLESRAFRFFHSGTRLQDVSAARKTFCCRAVC